jgi:uncharacterized repeat protein (TIGR04052 family)
VWQVPASTATDFLTFYQREIKMKKQFKTKMAASGLVAAAVLTACGGGSGDSAVAPATASLSGVVADGYLSGVKVYLDLNKNGAGDAGEPSATTDANGAYKINGIAAGDESKYPIVAEVPAISVDQDTNVAVGKPFTLTAPAGASFVSPITTLVQEKVRAGNSLAQADASVLASLGITTAGVSALENYVVKKGTAADQTNDYVRTHEAAKTLAKVLKDAKALVGSTGASTDQATQAVLVQQAESVMLTQKAANAATPAALFNQASVSAASVAGASTLKAAIAAGQLVAANATQAVTINFDVVNGATAVGASGCTTDLSLGAANAGVGTLGKIKDLRFYVSGVSLIDAAGNYAPLVLTENSNQGRNVALLDFETGTGGCNAGSTSTYTALVGKVAPGSYTGISFTVGVPVLSADGSTPVVALNHSYTAQALDDGAIKATPLPLQNTALNWTWQSGRKFTKIEFTANPVAPATTGVNTMVHLGSTGCVGDPVQGRITSCSSPNRPNFKLAGFNAASQKIALDLSVLFGGLDLSTSKTWMSGKGVGNPQGYFDKFALDMTTGLPVNDGAAQTLFKIE